MSENRGLPTACDDVTTASPENPPATALLGLPPARVRAALALAFLVSWYAFAGWRALFSPDEGRYAELARHVFASGDWVTPRLNGILYFEKPPLQYWITALAYHAFGLNEFAARFWPVTASALAVLGVARAGTRAIGATAAWWAAVLLASSVWWIANGHFLSLDAGVSSLLAGVLLALLHALHDDASPRQTRNAMLAAWALAGLAVLSKGLIGLLIPIGAVGLYVLVARDWRALARLHIGKGALVLLAVAAPWFVAVSMENPGFAQFFFVHEHFQRFTSTVHRRVGAPWYFVPVVIAGALPWTALLAPALLAATRRAPSRFQPAWLLGCWAVFVFAFFSASGSKLPSYVLPMFPALAMLVASWLVRASPRAIRGHAIAGAALAIVLAAVTGAGRLPGAFARADADDRLFLGWVSAGAAIVAAGFVAATIARHRRAATGLAVAALATAIGAQVAIGGHDVYSRQRSARALAGLLAPHLTPATPIFSVRYHDQSLPFYLRRTLVFVDYRDEFAFGLDQEPGRAIPTLAAFATHWHGLARAVAVLDPPTYDSLAAAGLPMRLLYRDGKRVAVLRQ